MTDKSTDPIGQFRNVTRETITLEGAGGPRSVEMVALHSIDFVRAGLPAVCFDVTKPATTRANAAVKHMESIQDDAEKSLAFTVRVVKAAVVSPRLWGDPESLVADTPEGYLHWRELGNEYLEMALLEAMRMSGLLTTEATLEAIRMFREQSRGEAGGEGGDPLRDDTEQVTPTAG